MIAVCSHNTRASTQNSRSYMLKTGASAWGRDPYHLLGEGKRTLCGRDCSEWLTIGPLESIDSDCCIRCASRSLRAIAANQENES